MCLYQTCLFDLVFLMQQKVWIYFVIYSQIQEYFYKFVKKKTTQFCCSLPLSVCIMTVCCDFELRLMKVFQIIWGNGDNTSFCILSSGNPLLLDPYLSLSIMVLQLKARNINVSTTLTSPMVAIWVIWLRLIKKYIVTFYRNRLLVCLEAKHEHTLDDWCGVHMPGMQRWKMRRRRRKRKMVIQAGPIKCFDSKFL